MSSQCLRLLCM